MPKKGSVFGAPQAVEDDGDQQLTLDELSNALGSPVNELPPIVRRRVDALTNLHKQYLGVQKQFQVELVELEKKYQKLYDPILDKRATIVTGSHEPTDEEAQVEKKEEEEEVKKREAKPEDADIKGIPQYWLTVLQNNIHVAQSIYENDEDALTYLKDIRSAELEGEEQGFTLTFHFAENPYFTNTTLTKTYHMTEEEEYFGEQMLDRASGTKINWKAGKNLTVKQVKKKTKAKGKKPARVVTVDEPTSSFFTFFTPPQIEEEEEQDPEEEEALEADFDIGCIIKEKLIPHSVLWFTGEAAKFEDEFDDFDGDEEDEDEGEEDEDEDEDEEDEEPPKRGKRVAGPGHSFAPPPSANKGGAGAPGQPQQPECKQQ